jgi:hypothetical protein
MGLAEYSDKNRSLRICERIGWQAKAPAPRACRSFGSKVGQTLSSVRPTIRPIFSRLPTVTVLGEPQ